MQRVFAARGFTLIEIAVVLGIIMIVLSLGLTAISSQLASASYTITKKRQDAIKDALINYFGAHNSLPCPEVPNNGNPVDGVAPANPPACPAFGVVPFKTLGLASELAQDGWGNLMSYQLYSDATPVCPGVGRDWGNSQCFGAGKTGALTVRDGLVTDAVPVNLTTSVVAVVISHGVNGLGAWVAAQGTRNAPPMTCEEAQNAVGTAFPSSACAGSLYAPNIFYKGEKQGNDDVVAYLTASDVFQPLMKQGTVVSTNAQVNLDLQTLYLQALALKSTFVNTIPGTVGPPATPPTAAGCKTPVNPPSPPAPANALTTMLASMRDPWGNPYVVDETSSGVVSPGVPEINGFPICIYSLGDPSANPPGQPASRASGITCSCSLPTICKSISESSFNVYIANSGTPACTPPSP